MLCRTCDYNLRGSPGPHCPECGRPFSRRDPSSVAWPEHTRHDRHIYRLAIAGIATPIPCAALGYIGRLSGEPYALLAAFILALVLSPCFLMGIALCFRPELRDRPRRLAVIRYILIASGAAIIAILLGLGIR